MIDFRTAKDRRGSYRVDWSQMKNLDSAWQDAVRQAFSPARIRQFAKSLTDMADLIERGGK